MSSPKNTVLAVLLLSASLVTHTLPAPTLIATGSRPTGIVPVTRLVTGSIQETVSSPELVTQTPSRLTATPTGCLPMEIVATTWFVRGSIREMALSPNRATQI